MDDLVQRVAGQQVCASKFASRRSSSLDDDSISDDEKTGRRARVQTSLGVRNKAMKGLIGGVAESKADEKRHWTELLIPWIEEQARANPDDGERTTAAATAWGCRGFREVKAAMREAGREKKRDSHPSRT